MTHGVGRAECAGTVGNAGRDASSYGQSSRAEGALCPCGAPALQYRRHPWSPPPGPAACEVLVRFLKSVHQHLHPCCCLWRRATSGTVSPPAFCAPHHRLPVKGASPPLSPRRIASHKAYAAFAQTVSNIAHPITVSHGAAVERLRLEKTRILGAIVQSGGSPHGPGRLTAIQSLRCLPSSTRGSVGDSV